MPRIKLKTDDQILDAIGIFLQREGLSNFTFRKLSQEVELSEATLIQRFGSKDDLFLRLSQRNADTIKVIFQTAAEAVDDPLGGLVAGFTTFVAGITDATAIGPNIAFLQIAMNNPRIHQAISTSMKGLEAAINDLLQEAIARCRLKDDTETAVLAHRLLVVYNGTVMTWAMLGRGDLKMELSNNLYALLRPYVSNSSVGDPRTT